MINELYLDVGGDHVPDGQSMGCSLREDNPGTFFPLLGDVIPTIPREQWREITATESIEWLIRKIKNQGRWPSCTANAATQAFEILWNMTFGKKLWIEFSPISLYKHCGNASSGSSVSCISRVLKEIGILPADTPSNRQWMLDVGLNPDHVMDPVDYRATYPRNCDETSKQFRLAEVYDIDSYVEFGTSLQNAWPVVYGRHGHALCGVRVVKGSRDNWVIRYANSWAPSWGDHGFGWDTESYVSPSLRTYGAIGYRSVHVPEFMT